MPVTQNVTFSATPPTTGENPTTFNYNAISCWDDLKNNIVPALNTAFGQLNELETNVNAKEASAVVAAFAAVAAANFQGTWTDQLTEVGQSWEYSGIIYAVIIAGTASPATTPSNWYALNVRPELVLSNSGFTATLQSGTLSGDVVHTLPSTSSNLAPTASPSFTGTPTVNGVAFSGHSGFKNYIINGGFDVWQRGITFTAGGYTADRWLVNQVGGTVTVSTTYTGSNSAWLGSRNVWQGTVGSGVTAWSLVQRIESVETLNNKIVTLSFVGAVNSGTMQFNIIRLVQNFGSGGSGSVVTNVQTVTLTTTPQKYSISVTLPSVNGKAIGANSYLELILQGTTVNVGQTVYISQVQLEEGSVATPFENRPIGLELSLCQRYARIMYVAVQNQASTVSGQITVQNMSFPDMRVIPTLTNINVAYTGSINSSNFILVQNNRIQYEFYYGLLNALGGGARTDLLSAEL